MIIANANNIADSRRGGGGGVRAPQTTLYPRLQCHLQNFQRTGKISCESMETRRSCSFSCLSRSSHLQQCRGGSRNSLTGGGGGVLGQNSSKGGGGG